MSETDKLPAGPWEWMGSGIHGVYLATTHSGRQYLMGFKRRGTQGAEPVFRHNNRMVPASELLQFDVGDQSVVGIEAAKANETVYRYDVRGIDNPVARLLAASPLLLESVEQLLVQVDIWGKEGADPVGDAVIAAARSACAIVRGDTPSS